MLAYIKPEFFLNSYKNIKYLKEAYPFSALIQKFIKVPWNLNWNATVIDSSKVYFTMMFAEP